MNGILSSPAAAIVSSRTRRVLGRRALVDDEIRVDRLEHQPLGRRDLAQPGQIRAHRARPRFVCGSSPRSSARSHTHTTYEVKSSCPYSARAPRHPRVHLGLLAGEHQQLLHVMARHRPIEQLQDLLGRVQMRLVRRERAVLAVAAACPRQRQREVPAERDTAAHARGPFYERPPRLRAPILARLMRGAIRARAAAPACWLRCRRAAGCGSGTSLDHARRDHDGARASAATRAPQNATLILDFTPNAVHTGIYAALARHYDRDAGVRLHVIAPTATTDSIKLLETGQVDFAILDIHDLAIADESSPTHPGIVGIMAIVERPLAAVIAAPGIASPQGAPGQDRRDHGRPQRHRGAQNRRSPDPAAIPAKVKTITIGFNAVADLLAGRVAGATGVLERRGRDDPVQAAGIPRVQGRRLRRALLPRARALRDRRDPAPRPGARARSRRRARPRLRLHPERPAAGGAGPRAGRPPGSTPKLVAAQLRRPAPRLPGRRRPRRRARQGDARDLGRVGGSVRDRQPGRPTSTRSFDAAFAASAAAG